MRKYSSFQAQCDSGIDSGKNMGFSPRITLYLNGRIFAGEAEVRNSQDTSRFKNKIVSKIRTSFTMNEHPVTRPPRVRRSFRREAANVENQNQMPKKTVPPKAMDKDL
jgi:hypothetical protein